MDTARIFGIPAALLILAVVANRLSKLTRVPDIIVLLLVGIGIGPILGWVHPGRAGDGVHIMGTLALVLILFEGGLELRLKETIRNLPGGLLLCIVSFCLSTSLVALILRLALHLSWIDGFLIGGAFGANSGSVILPVLQQIEAPAPVKVTLTLESALGEVLAVLTVGTLMTLAASESVFSGLFSGFANHITVDVLVGLAVGVAWSRLWPLFATQPFVNALNLGVILGVYSLSRWLGGSGLLAELVFGLTLANMPRTPHMTRQGARMIAFHQEFTFLVRSLFFVLLGTMAQAVSRHYILPIIGILAALVAARNIAVRSTLWAIRESTAADMELLFFMLPRGLITAVLALEIATSKGTEFSFVPAMAFTVVLATNAFVVAASVRAPKPVAAAALAGEQSLIVAPPPPELTDAAAAGKS